MDHCLYCGKYIGFRGFCSKKCHDAYYDELTRSLEKDKEYYEYCSKNH